jgi:hypothetical protein
MNLLNFVLHCLLVPGMAFQSGVAAEGSGPHLALTYAVAIVLVASVCTFFAMLGREIYRSAKLAHRARTSRRRAWNLNLKSSADSDATRGPRVVASTGRGHPDGAASGPLAGPSLSLRGPPQSVWRTNPLRADSVAVSTLPPLQQDWASTSSAQAHGSATRSPVVAAPLAAPSADGAPGSHQGERVPNRAARAALASRGARPHSGSAPQSSSSPQAATATSESASVQPPPPPPPPPPGVPLSTLSPLHVRATPGPPPPPPAPPSPALLHGLAAGRPSPALGPRATLPLAGTAAQTGVRVPARAPFHSQSQPSGTGTAGGTGRAGEPASSASA